MALGVASVLGMKVFLSFLSVISSVEGYYSLLVNAGLLEDRKDVKSYVDKLKVARKISEFVKTGLTMLKDMNKDLSKEVEATLALLQRLDSNLQRNRREIESNPRQSPDEIQKLEEIYSDLEAALNSIKLKVDANNESKANTTRKFQLKLQQWATTTSTKQQLKEINKKIKDAEQKSIELTTISTSAAVARSNMLQYFQISKTWPIQTRTVIPPKPPRQLDVKEVSGNKFALTWWKNKGDTLDYFELCYDEDQHLSIPLEGNVYKTEIGSPQVEPGRIYTIKIRGVNEGGSGNWSSSVVAKFIKPSPRKPDPPQVWMTGDSTAVMTVQRPKPYCETESRVMKWNVEYNVGLKWETQSYTKIKEGRNKVELKIQILYPKKTYNFRVQAVNANGNSTFSVPVSMKAEYKTFSNRMFSHIEIFFRTVIY